MSYSAKSKIQSVLGNKWVSTQMRNICAFDVRQQTVKISAARFVHKLIYTDEQCNAQIHTQMGRHTKTLLCLFCVYVRVVVVVDDDEMKTLPENSIQKMNTMKYMTHSRKLQRQHTTEHYFIKILWHDHFCGFTPSLSLRLSTHLFCPLFLFPALCLNKMIIFGLTLMDCALYLMMLTMTLTMVMVLVGNGGSGSLLFHFNQTKCAYKIPNRSLY